MFIAQQPKARRIAMGLSLCVDLSFWKVLAGY
jgi:hypothetical protein